MTPWCALLDRGECVVAVRRCASLERRVGWHDRSAGIARRPVRHEQAAPPPRSSHRRVPAPGRPRGGRDRRCAHAARRSGSRRDGPSRRSSPAPSPDRGRSRSDALCRPRSETRRQGRDGLPGPSASLAIATRRLDPVPYRELVENAADVRLDRPARDRHRGRDVTVGQPVAQQSKYVVLSRRQSVQRLVGRPVIGQTCGARSVAGASLRGAEASPVRRRGRRGWP